MYPLPLLLDILPSLHWVCAMLILLKDSITNVLIDAAEQMLFDFVSLMPELYGSIFLSILYVSILKPYLIPVCK